MKQLHLSQVPVSVRPRTGSPSPRPVKDAQRAGGQALNRGAALLVVGVALLGAGLALRVQGSGSPATTYGYIRSEVAWLVYGEHHYAYLQPKERELWVAPDGSGRLLEEFGPPDFLGPRAHAELASTYQLPRPNRIDFAPGSLLPHPSFPADAASFEALVSEETAERKSPRPLSVLRIVRSLLTERIAPASTRSLLLTELLDEPGLQRSCAPDGFTFSTEAGSPLVHYSLTLDQTGTLRREELTLLEPDAAIDGVPPVTVGRASYIATGTVAGLESRRLTPLPTGLSTLPTCPIRG